MNEHISVLGISVKNHWDGIEFVILIRADENNGCRNVVLLDTIIRLFHEEATHSFSDNIVH